MRIFLLFCLLLSAYFSKGNMAEPMIYGSQSAEAFTSEYVDILHEDLTIKVLNGFSVVEVTAIYSIRAERSGKQIPMVFYADYYLDSFVVKVDGRLIPHFGKDYDAQLNGTVNGFKYFEDNDLPLSLNENSWTNVGLDDMIYFELELDSGEHQIEVLYQAYSSTSQYEKINSYFFTYDLSPVNHWRSFAELDFSLDLSESGIDIHEIALNFDKDISENDSKILKWSFKELPVELIKIEYYPTISRRSEFFSRLGAWGFAGILILPLLILQHLILIKTWRKKQKFANLISIPLILFVSIIFIALWWHSVYWVDDLIGVHANRFHGYSQLWIIVALPFYVGFNFILAALSRRRFNKKYKV